MVSPVPAPLRPFFLTLAVFFCLNVAFLAAESSAADAGPPLADPPATSLDLVLMGIIDGGSRDRRAVILCKKDHVQQLYQVGDLVGGARIQRILWGKVVLRTDDGEEVLDINGAASYRSTANPPIVGPAPLVSAVSPQAKDIVPADNRETDERLIPERVRLVLPDQADPEVENGTPGEAEKDE